MYIYISYYDIEPIYLYISYQGPSDELGLGARPRIVFNAAISACEKASRWSHALELLTMTRSDVVSHNAAMSACEKASRWEQALQVFKHLAP